MFERFSMYLAAAALGLSVVILCVGAASADAFTKKREQAWEVNCFPHRGDVACYAVIYEDDGTSMSIGYNPDTDNWIVSFGGFERGSFDYGSTYELGMRFQPSGSRWSSDGFETGETEDYLYLPVVFKVVKDAMEDSYVEIWANGENHGAFSLRGSRDAIIEAYNLTIGSGS